MAEHNIGWNLQRAYNCIELSFLYQQYYLLTHQLDDAYRALIWRSILEEMVNKNVSDAIIFLVGEEIRT